MGVSKCCCCFSLKYGFLTFAILSLIYRVCTAISLFYFNPHMFETTSSSSLSSSLRMNEVDTTIIINGLMSSVGVFAGWYVITAGLLIVCIKGIFEKRAILLYPYIVILILEMIVLVVSSIIISIIISPVVLLSMVIVAGFDTYVCICLISLYKNFKEYERSHSQPPYLPSYEVTQLKTV